MATPTAYSQYLSQSGVTNLRLPIDSEVVSPFIRIQFTDETGTFTYITVGNKSVGTGNNTSISGDDATAAITSFEFGSQDGVSCNFEIADQDGGEFQLFSQKILNKLGELDHTLCVYANIEFGWVSIDKNGNTHKYSSQDVTIVCLQIQQMKVKYSHTMVKYAIVAKDLIAGTSTRENKLIGTDSQPLDVKEALKKLFGDSNPHISLKFLKFGSDGAIINNPVASDDEMQFKHSAKIVLDANNQHKLAAAHQTLSNFVTENDKGVIRFWDVSSCSPTLIFCENPYPEPGSGNVQDKKFVGTYIVNGGAYSNVLSFDPNIDIYGAQAQLGHGGGFGTGTAKPEAIDNTTATNPAGTNAQTKYKEAGTQQTVNMTRQALDAHGPKEGLNKHKEAMGKHALASIFEVRGCIDATLIVQGDPTLVGTLNTIGKWVSLIVINPFQLKGSGDCGMWLAEPAVNTILTSKDWKIYKVVHSIQNGSFVTTFSIRLVSPNQNGNPTP